MTLKQLKEAMNNLQILADFELMAVGAQIKSQPTSLKQVAAFALWRAEVERRNIKRDPKKYAAGYGAAALTVVGITSL
tara:strand:+ start:41 stop:274 length:234 start_codon:yes stop_codon:yes gene_type:complete